MFSMLLIILYFSVKILVRGVFLKVIPVFPMKNQKYVFNYALLERVFKEGYLSGLTLLSYFS